MIIYNFVRTLEYTTKLKVVNEIVTALGLLFQISEDYQEYFIEIEGQDILERWSKSPNNKIV